MKYIDADRLRAEIEGIGLIPQKQADYNDGRDDVKMMVLDLIDSLQQEQPDFPTTDEEIERFLTTHSKVEVPDKYKTPDWLWKQPEADLEKEYKEYVEDDPVFSILTNRNVGLAIARHFAHWGC